MFWDRLDGFDNYDACSFDCWRKTFSPIAVTVVVAFWAGRSGKLTENWDSLGVVLCGEQKLSQISPTV